MPARLFAPLTPLRENAATRGARVSTGVALRSNRVLRSRRRHAAEGALRRGAVVVESASMNTDPNCACCAEGAPLDALTRHVYSAAREDSEKGNGRPTAG